jgi:hypothetical protein
LSRQSNNRVLTPRIRSIGIDNFQPSYFVMVGYTDDSHPSFTAVSTVPTVTAAVLTRPQTGHIVCSKKRTF